MLIKSVHRQRCQEIPFGKLIWYKEFERHEELHYDLSWTPPFFVVLLFTQGRGFYKREDGFSCEINAGDVLQLFPNKASGFKSESGSPLDCLLYGFDGPIFDLWKRSKLLDEENPLYSLPSIESWKKRWLDIPLPEETDIPDRDVIETCQLQKTLSDMRHASAQHRTASDRDSWQHEVHTILESEVRTSLDFSDVASRVNMNPETFRKRFRRHFGVSPKRYYDRLLAEKASLLLRNKTLSCWQVADSLGFPDEFSFSKFFKRVVGLPPSQYRTRYVESVL